MPTLAQLRCSACFVLLSFSWMFAAHADDELPPTSRQLLRTRCYDCHEGVSAEGGLDLAKLSTNLDDDATAEKWARVVDRVHDGEMPPPDAEKMAKEEQRRFVKATGDWIRAYQQADYQTRGRVRGRRLTNLQLERSLHDLLGVDIPLARLMPEEPRTDGFTTVARGQSMSHFQLEQHVGVVDAALDESFRRAFSRDDEWERLLPAKEIVRRNPRRRTREPEMMNGHAVVWMAGTTFYGRVPATTAREDGWYRFTVRAKALNKPDGYGVWCTVRSGACVSSAPLLAWLGAFEANDEIQEMTFEGWLPRGHMLEIRPGDKTLKSGRFAGGQIGTGEGAPQKVPGVAIESIKMERIHHGATNDRVRDLLFYKHRVQKDAKGKEPSVQTNAPKKDATKLMLRFARRAFRRPMTYESIQRYIKMVHAALDSGEAFHVAIRGGYRALLCSPRFLYFHEDAGTLDDYALATRLSYMLWNRPPDYKTLQAVKAGQFRDATTYHAQVDRMLDDWRGKTFVEDLAAQWLDLQLIDFTEPDRKLYPGFDIIVQQSMLDETHAYLHQMLRDDESVTRLIDSDFTFLNSRLARHYDVDGVYGSKIRSVKLRDKDHRGGLLTHGSILKVTANGTTTSPVIRGVWVSERLLGEEIPPPPENVPAIEPDIRGAKSIREQLAKHTSDTACASCHTKIDPPGFALENFDPAGRWRDHYGRRGRKRNKGPVVDASFVMPDGRKFADFDHFQELVRADKESLARNVVEKLVTYGTGAPISFADRQVVDSIVQESAESGYGFRSIVHAVVASPLFKTK